MKTNAEQMNKEYQNAKFDIASLLDRIGQELEKTPQRINWGHVGDLTGLRQNLIEALSGMTGMAEHAIRETLEDIRTDAQALKEQEAQDEKRRLNIAKQNLNEVRKSLELQ